VLFEWDQVCRLFDRLCSGSVRVFSPLRCRTRQDGREFHCLPHALRPRETEILQKYPAIFIIGIGWTLKDGYPHEMRAADYDDWITETINKNGETYHGLNGDILVWNPVTQRRHELTSMGIRVTKETLKKQLELSNQIDFLDLPYHQAILNDEIPLSIGGGIGQSRTYMLLLRKAHLGECSVTVWPQKLKEICEEKNINVLY